MGVGIALGFFIFSIIALFLLAALFGITLFGSVASAAASAHQTSSPSDYLFNWLPNFVVSNQRIIIPLVLVCLIIFAWKIRPKNEEPGLRDE